MKQPAKLDGNIKIARGPCLSQSTHFNWETGMTACLNLKLCMPDFLLIFIKSVDKLATFVPISSQLLCIVFK